MGDSADYTRLTEVEARLAAALDRIATGLAARAAPSISAPGDGTSTAEAEEARQEAETRAEEAEARVAALEARLAETQDALSDTQADLQAAMVVQMKRDAELADRPDPEMQPPGTDAAALVALEKRLAEAEAARGLAVADLAERDAALAEKDALLADAQEALAEAEAKLAAAQSGADEAEAKPRDADIEDMEKALALMGRRVERARAERDAARIACDAATDMADELREAKGITPDKRILDLRRQLRLMRARAEDLSAEMSILRSGAGVDPSALDQGLRAEVETLRQLRETDAAELDRILQEMQAGLEEANGTDKQEGAGHA